MPSLYFIDGQTVLKPAFSVTYQDIGTLPTDVVSVEMESGVISLGIQNNLGFDPIRPAVADPGTMTMTLYDGDITGPVLAQVVLDGSTDALPDGMLTTIPLNLVQAPSTSTILTVIDIVSPLGDTNVLIDVKRRPQYHGDVGTILVSSATVNVDGLTVDIAEQQLDLQDIDADICVERSDRIIDPGYSEPVWGGLQASWWKSAAPAS